MENPKYEMVVSWLLTLMRNGIVERTTDEDLTRMANAICEILWKGKDNGNSGSD